MTSVDVQTLTSSRDCASPGCANEAEPGGELCPSCASAAAGSGHAEASQATPFSDPLGLQLPADVDLDTWTMIVRRVAAVANATRFWIGDLLAAGRFPEGHKYELAEREFGLDRSTLTTYCYVARHVERERRRADLPFAIFAVVAPLEPVQQAHWLARAADERLTCLQLRAELAAAGLQAPPAGSRVPPPRPPPPSPAVLEQLRLTIVLRAELAARLRSEARSRGTSMSQLAAEALERHLVGTPAT